MALPSVSGHCPVPQGKGEGAESETWSSPASDRGLYRWFPQFSGFQTHISPLALLGLQLADCSS